ncbi:hypothetical protein RHMOL_Rhmol01G0210500 [Rhododendron molle]|uniref:Uncharacterized protein n=1 Tax=Rhododendron molle TaxID=49168 RepID=A0ACC0Q4A4_RHOML|nr:hypothetical protein RHMOL_Rhmol01G0210500 [Rhododendron molle]
MTGKELKLSSSSSCCCISHEFLKAATKNPNKIAVIHASGGAKIAREFRNSNRGSTTVSDINYDKFYGDLLETAPSSRPLVYDGDRCFTFSDVLSAVDSLSYRLRRILDDPSSIVRASTGVEQSTEDQVHYTPKIVGICVEPSAEYIVAVLSVLRCGEAFIALDPLWPTERISSIVSCSNVNVIIRCQSSFDGNGCYELCKSHGAVDFSSCPQVFVSMKENLRQEFGSASSAWPCESEKSRSFCYVLYTSGSTGKPKGVCGTEIGKPSLQFACYDLSKPQYFF